LCGYFAGNCLRLYKTHSDAVRSMYLYLRPANVGHGTRGWHIVCVCVYSLRIVGMLVDIQMSGFDFHQLVINMSVDC